MGIYCDFLSNFGKNTLIFSLKLLDSGYENLCNEKRLRFRGRLRLFCKSLKYSLTKRFLIVLISTVLTIVFCFSLAKYLLEHNEAVHGSSNPKTEETLLESLAEEFQRQNEFNDEANIKVEDNSMKY